MKHFLLILPLYLLASFSYGQEMPEVPGTWDGHVKGIGGIFFKVEDPAKVTQWYQDHFGIPAVEPGFAHFFWRDYLQSNRTNRTVWSPFPMNSELLENPKQQFMINYIVDDLDTMLAELKASGIEQVGETEDYPYGRFAWIIDVEGNKVELWEAVVLED
ncbi:MAG: VOC family protein [Pseudohongiellaceae bacterium]